MKTSAFAGLAAQVDKPFRVHIIHPATGRTVADKDGNPAFIEVLSADSTAAETFDRERQRKLNDAAKSTLLAGTATPDDETPEVVAKLAALTSAWHLVDIATGEVIDVPCTPENAQELYVSRATRWIYLQVMPQAANIANFLPPSSKG